MCLDINTVTYQASCNHEPRTGTSGSRFHSRNLDPTAPDTSGYTPGPTTTTTPDIGLVGDGVVSKKEA